MTARNRLLFALLALAGALLTWFLWPDGAPTPATTEPSAATAPAPAPPAVAEGAADAQRVTEEDAGRDRRARSAAAAGAVRIEGFVDASAAMPIAGATVRLVRAEPAPGGDDPAGVRHPWQPWMARMAVRLRADVPALATTAVAADGTFAFDGVDRPGKGELAVVLDHDFYALPGPQPVPAAAAGAAVVQIGELQPYLGALVRGTVRGFDDLGRVTVRAGTEIDAMAPMNDPQRFAAQVSMHGALEAAPEPDGSFRFRAVPPSPSVTLSAAAGGRVAGPLSFAVAAGEVRECSLTAEQGGQLRVTVLGDDGGPVPQARVSFTPDGLSGLSARLLLATSARTGDDGTAVLADLAAGPGTVSADGRRMVGDRTPVVVQAGGTTEVQLRLRQGGRVAGTVVDHGGRPLADAGIADFPAMDIPMFGDIGSLLGPETWGAAASRSDVRTDAEGRFELTGLTHDGAFNLLVACDGFVPHMQPDVTVGELDLRITMQPAAALVGRVLRGADESPQSTFSVTLEKTMFMVMPLTVRAQDFDGAIDGRFTIADLAPGKVQVRIGAPGLATIERDVTLEAGTHTDLGDVTLSQPSRIEGRVLSHDNAPVHRARVRLQRGGLRDNELLGAMFGASTSVATDADGGFVLGDVPAGRVRVLAKAPDHAPTSSDRIAIGEGEVVRDVVIRLDVGSTIRGHLLLPPGTHRGGWEVIAADLRGADSRTARWTGDDSFAIPHLAPGVYNVQAMDTGAMTRANDAFASEMMRGGGFDMKTLFESVSRHMVQQRVRVRPGEDLDIELDARELGAQGGDAVTLRCDVRIGDRPLAGGFAEVVRSGGSQLFAVVDDGVLTCSGLQAGTSVQIQIREGVMMAPVGPRTTVAIPEGVTEHRTTIDLPGGGLAGRVVHDGSGEPLANALVRVRPEQDAPDDEPEFGFAVTDADGAFSFSALAPGTYTLVADDQLVPRQGRAGGRLEGVRIAAGEHRADLLLRARPAAGLTVTVTGPHGEPVAHAMLQAVDGDGRPLGSGSVTYTDGDGRAFFAGLPAGETRVAAAAAGYAPGCSPAVHVAAGMEMPVSVQLAHGTRVAVKVRDADGAVHADALIAVRWGSAPWIPASLLGIERRGDELDLGELPPGRVHFRVWAPGLPVFEVARDIPTARRASLELTPAS